MIVPRFVPAAVLGIALVLAGCGEDPVRPSTEAIAAAQAEIARTPARQPRMMAPEEAQAVLRRIDQRIRPAAVKECRARGGERCAWSIAYEPAATFNAFASGRDRIVMYGGIFALARSEEEIAMVLAHEKAHHILDHVAETNRNAGIGAFIADILVSVGAVWLAQELGLPLPAALVDSLRSAAAGAGAQAGVLAFSIENEKEADALAAAILHASGYDLDAARGMIVTMGAMSKGDRTPNFLRTHPAGPERLAHWETVVSGLRRTQAPARTQRLADAIH
jgi:Zn-dependent protease with chaperone function